jgi:hypothetical protein
MAAVEGWPAGARNPRGRIVNSADAKVGLGPIVALYCRSSTSYQIFEHIRYLYF